MREAMWRLIVGGVIVCGVLGVASDSRATAGPTAQQREVRVPDNLPDGVVMQMGVLAKLDKDLAARVIAAGKRVSHTGKGSKNYDVFEVVTKKALRQADPDDAAKVIALAEQVKQDKATQKKNAQNDLVHGPLQAIMGIALHPAINLTSGVGAVVLAVVEPLSLVVTVPMWIAHMKAGGYNRVSDNAWAEFRKAW